MILSYTHNFLFIKAQKIAGTSMEIALSKFCGDRDIITPIGKEADSDLRKDVSHRDAQNIHFTAVSGEKIKFHDHMRPLRCWHCLPRKLWNQLHKWTIVRNPFDLIISRFAFEKPQHDKSLSVQENFRLWLPQYAPQHLENMLHFYFFFAGDTPDTTEPYRKCLDSYLRYEQLKPDIRALSRTLQLPENLWRSFKKITAKSSYRNEQFGVDTLFAGFPEGIALVEQHARPVLETFGYASPKA